MSSRMRVVVDVIVHATEDLHLIESSMRSVLGLEVLVRKNAAGHFGNPITTVHAELDGPAASAFVSVLLGKLSGRGRADPDSGGSPLYLRLDKQALVNGAIREIDGGSVRVRISVPMYGTAKGRILRGTGPAPPG